MTYQARKLASRDPVPVDDPDVDPEEKLPDEKVSQIRRIRGGRLEDTGHMEAGDIAAVYGLSRIRIGDVIGQPDPSREVEAMRTEPLLLTEVTPANPEEKTRLYEALSILSEEDPLLSLERNTQTDQIFVHIMGTIQTEILTEILMTRFGIRADFAKPRIIYKEKPGRTAEGFEAYTMPKPCWAIVRLRMEPLPEGSGMGTSSILGACTVAALDRIAGRSFNVQRVMELTLQLEQEMHTGGGWEDQMGALVPGVKILRTKAGKRQHPTWKTIADPKGFAKLLAARGLLYFTGEKRMARNVLRGVIANYKSDGEEGRARVAALRDGAERCYKAIASGEWERFAACVNEYWMLKKAMDPGSTNERVEYIIARISPWTSAVTLAGAGGGGFMFILAKSPAAKRKIIAALNRRPPVRWARFYDFALDGKGITFHV